MTVSLEAAALPWARIADALGTGLVLVDQGGRIVHWNAWMAKHSHVDAAQALGQTLENVFGDGLAASFKRALANVLKHKMPVVLSNVLHRDPLPLYRQANATASAAPAVRMPQSVTLMPIQTDDGAHLCLVQITDTSMFVKRERVLQSNSDRLSKEAVIDGLTGVYNRRYFNEKLPLEMSRAMRQSLPFSLLMLDVDAFKKYNDTYGHPAGDRVLVSIVTAAHSQLNRSSDILARYGGEEFVVMLSDCDKSGAQLVAERIRHAISDLRIPHARSEVAGHITVSIGAATCGPGDYGNNAELLEAADRALYAAKHAGRNAVRWLAADKAKQPPPATGQ